MDASHWDTKYAERELVWGSEPNRWVAAECADLAPGRALDLACGEGRNAIWLARRGWQVTGVDFSAVALARAADLFERSVAERGLDLTAAQGQGPGLTGRASWDQADVLEYRPPAGSFDLVVIAYLQLPAEQRRVVVQAAVQGVAPGGTLLVVAHDAANLGVGVGGPQDPRVLYTADDLVADLDDRPGVDVLRAEPVRRPVEVDGQTRYAVDALLLARRAGA